MRFRQEKEGWLRDCEDYDYTPYTISVKNKSRRCALQAPSADETKERSFARQLCHLNFQELMIFPTDVDEITQSLNVISFEGKRNNVVKKNLA
jgi:hypothetical protein